MKENQNLREQPSGGEGGVGICEIEVKVKDDSPKCLPWEFALETQVFIMHTKCSVNIY